MKNDNTNRSLNRSANKSEQKMRSVRFMLVSVSWMFLIISGFFVSLIFVVGYVSHIQIIRGMSTVWLMLTPIALSIVISMILVAIWTIKTLRPVKQLTQATNQVRQGNFSVRIPEPADRSRRSELNQLIISFNLMLEELEHNEIFRKDFINNFSHEFKTPIVSIRGFARELYNEDLTEEQRREYIGIIIAESDRLAGMSANVLLLSRLENQTIVTDKTRFALDEQLRSEILLLEAAWTKKDLCITPELDSVEYDGSAELLSHVWRNLLNNAIKFAPDHSELRINLCRVDGQIVVEIIDEGPGMDEETAARIFDKFYQGDTSHKSEGNGLGLSIAKRSVVLCGGTITVKSAPGQGCTFTVTLPE